MGGRVRGAVALLTAVSLVAALLVTGGLLFGDLASGGGPSGPKTAVIVDQLSLTQPNQAFVEEATATLERGGYVVDYFPGEEVTVEFYRELPTHGYDIIVLRSHAGRLEYSDSGRLTEIVGLFTSDPYDRETYYEEQLAGRLAFAYYNEGGPLYFGVLPEFIRSAMRGDFDGATIVMMGCDGLRSRDTAEAFLERGAGAFVSWSDQVSAAHTDAATERLLERLLLDGLTVAEAVRETAAEVGPDPVYNAELRVLQ